MVLTLPGEIDQRNTYQEILYDVPMIAAVSEASPLAEKSVVSLSDLRAYPLILLALDQSRSGRGRSTTGRRIWDFRIHRLFMRIRQICKF